MLPDGQRRSGGKNGERRYTGCGDKRQRIENCAGRALEAVQGKTRRDGYVEGELVNYFISRISYHRLFVESMMRVLIVYEFT